MDTDSKTPVDPALAKVLKSLRERQAPENRAPEKTGTERFIGPLRLQPDTYYRFPANRQPKGKHWLILHSGNRSIGTYPGLGFHLNQITFNLIQAYARKPGLALSCPSAVTRAIDVGACSFPEPALGGVFDPEPRHIKALIAMTRLDMIKEAASYYSLQASPSETIDHIEAYFFVSREEAQVIFAEVLERWKQDSKLEGGKEGKRSQVRASYRELFRRSVNKKRHVYDKRSGNIFEIDEPDLKTALNAVEALVKLDGLAEADETGAGLLGTGLANLAAAIRKREEG